MPKGRERLFFALVQAVTHGPVPAAGLLCFWHNSRVPFHVGGHKPHASPPKRVVRIRHRLLVTICGALGIFGGAFRIQNGFDHILNWWGAPVYLDGLIIGGVIVILLAWVPVAWMEKAVTWGLKRSVEKSK
jgi:hypothetical protein